MHNSNNISIIGNHQGAIDSIIYDPKRHQLVSAGRDGKILAHDLTNYSTTVIYTLDNFNAGHLFHRLDLLDDILVVGMTSGMCVWLDLANNITLKTIEALEYAISDVSIAKNGVVALVGDSDVIKLYDQNYSCIWEGATYKFPYSVNFSPDQKKFIIATWDGYLYEVKLDELPQAEIDENGEVWPADLGYPNHPDPGSPIFRAQYLSENKVVLAGYKNYNGSSGFLRIWDINKNEFIENFLPTEGIHAIAVSPSGKYLAAGGNNQTIWVWTLNDFEMVCEWKLGNMEESPDELTSDEEFALRMKRVGMTVDGFDHIKPSPMSKDVYFPAVIEFYKTKGLHTVLSLAFGSNDQTLYAGVQNGSILEFII